MSNSKIMLLTKGEEDTYLTDNSKHSFFKSPKKTYSYFGQNWNAINPSNNLNFNESSFVTMHLPIEGDLITNVLLRLNVSGETLANDSAGRFHALEFIESVTFKYNDQVLSTIDYNYIALYHKLHCNNCQYKQFIDLTSLTKESLENNFKDINRDERNNVLHIPLPFWFTKNPGSAFPIWLLTKPRLVVEIKLKTKKSLSLIRNLDLLVQYTNLTHKEKDVFKNSSLEYLIEQVDIVNKRNINNESKVKIDLPRNKYVKYLVWNTLPTIPTNDLKSEAHIKKTTILLNGTPILNCADANRTALVNRFSYFKTPVVNGVDFNGGASYKDFSDLNDLNIHSQVFCLNPSDFQSSGFLTTEKYNTFTLEIDAINSINSSTLHVYIIKHNILRFKDGILNLLHN